MNRLDCKNLVMPEENCNLRLYRGKIEVEMVVYARNQEQALELINKNLAQEVKNINGFSLELLIDSRQLDTPGWLSCIPYATDLGFSKYVKDLL